MRPTGPTGERGAHERHHGSRARAVGEAGHRFRRDRHRRRGVRPVSALPSARTWADGAGVRGRLRCRRDLELEPLSRRPVRFRKAGPTAIPFPRSCSTNGTGRSISPASRKPNGTLNHVADKFDLRRHIQFKTTVTAAHYQEDSRSWKVTLDNGTSCTARFLVTAVGVLSASVLPRHARHRELQGPIRATRITGRRNRSVSPASASR